MLLMVHVRIAHFYPVLDNENITSLIYIFISLVSVSCLNTINNRRQNIDNRQSWIQSILGQEGISVDSTDYLFYCTGHHGIIWSIITSDLSGIHLYNGTTRNHIKDTCHGLTDTLSFINANIKTIKWGFDSFANAAKLLTPLKNEAYNPVYNELCIIKNNKTVFCHNNTDYYSGQDSISFNYSLNKLVYLMYWLAAPSGRPYLPTPCDTLLTE